jgi:hypothetical protein
MAIEGRIVMDSLWLKPQRPFGDLREFLAILEERGVASWTTPGAVDVTEWVSQIRTVKVRRDPECPLCGNNPTISELIDLYTRPLPADELVLSVDEKTSLQPRPRLSPTRPAQPGNIPSRYEHAYKRNGALNLFAAFDTRSGTVFGYCAPRKRQQEFITFLEQLDAAIGHHIKTIHLVCDNVSTHHGQEVRRTAKKSADGW